MLNQVFVGSNVPSGRSAISGLSFLMSSRLPLKKRLPQLSSAPGWYSYGAAQRPAARDVARARRRSCRNVLPGPNGSSYTAVAGEPPGPAVVVGLPERRLPVVLFDRPVLGHPVHRQRAVAGEAVGVPPRQDDLERVGLDLAQRLIVVAQAVVRVAHVRKRAQQPVPRDRGRREERVRPASRCVEQPGCSSAARRSSRC